MNGKSGQKVRGKSGQFAKAARYARTPATVLFDKELSLSARCIYGTIALHVFQGTTARIGQRKIAQLLGVHQETVSAGLKELESRGHITIHSYGKSRGLYNLVSIVFGQKQRSGEVEELVSKPSGARRLASVRTA